MCTYLAILEEDGVMSLQVIHFASAYFAIIRHPKALGPKAPKKVGPILGSMSHWTLGPKVCPIGHFWGSRSHWTLGPKAPKKGGIQGTKWKDSHPRRQKNHLRGQTTRGTSRSQTLLESGMQHETSLEVTHPSTIPAQRRFS